jgi:endogenous inhibitor of DNA gyrase (YacG/DUF329 family)
MLVTLVIVLVSAALVAYVLMEKRINQRPCPDCGFRVSIDGLAEPCPRCGSTIPTADNNDEP